MKLFIESANLAELEQARDLGVLDGIVTRPAMFAREKVEPQRRLREIRQLTAAPIFVDVPSTDRRTMVRDAQEHIAAVDHTIVKLPATKDGLKACKQLGKEGLPVCMTLIYQVSQALLAGKAHAAWVCPYVPDFDENEEGDDLWLVTKIRQRRSWSPAFARRSTFSRPPRRRWTRWSSR
jgi:transaldolase